MTGITPTPRRARWFRRNLVALLTLVVAILGLVVVVLVIPTIDNQNQKHVTIVKRGESVEADGYRFTLTRSQEFVGTGTDTGENRIPLGSSLVGAIIQVTPLNNARTNASCNTDLTRQKNAQTLTWTQVSDVSQFNYAIGDGRSRYCILDGAAHTMEVVFLTPAGTYADAMLDVTGLGAVLSGDIYRFELPH